MVRGERQKLGISVVALCLKLLRTVLHGGFIAHPKIIPLSSILMD